MPENEPVVGRLNQLIAFIENAPKETSDWDAHIVGYYDDTAGTSPEEVKTGSVVANMVFLYEEGPNTFEETDPQIEQTENRLEFLLKISPHIPSDKQKNKGLPTILTREVKDAKPEFVIAIYQKNMSGYSHGGPESDTLAKKLSEKCLLQLKQTLEANKLTNDTTDNFFTRLTLHDPPSSPHDEIDLL